MSPFRFSSSRCPLAADQLCPDKLRLAIYGSLHHIHITRYGSLVRLALINPPGRGDASSQALEPAGCLMDACILLSWQLLFLRGWAKV